MIEEQTFAGGYLDIRLEPKPFPLRTAVDNAAFPRRPAALQAQLITLRFELRDETVTEIRAELVFDHASYTQAESAGHFGLSAQARSAAMGDQAFSSSHPVHVLVSADMKRIGPHQFEGLDLKNNRRDLKEVLMTIQADAPKSAFHEFETWTFITAQQKTSPSSDPIGFDRAQ